MIDAPENTAEYLRHLADVFFQIPVMYGIDEGDCDRLKEIATSMENFNTLIEKQNQSRSDRESRFDTEEREMSDTEPATQ